jgi:hypothetical protein
MMVVEAEDAEVRTLFSTWEVFEVAATEVNEAGVVATEE